MIKSNTTNTPTTSAANIQVDLKMTSAMARVGCSALMTSYTRGTSVLGSSLATGRSANGITSMRAILSRECLRAKGNACALKVLLFVIQKERINAGRLMVRGRRLA